MTRCAYTSRLMSVVGPEVMLNKYNLELKKKKGYPCGFTVTLQYYLGNPSSETKSEFEKTVLGKNQVSTEDDALFLQKKGGNCSAHTVLPAG